MIIAAMRFTHGPFCRRPPTAKLGMPARILLMPARILLMPARILLMPARFFANAGALFWELLVAFSPSRFSSSSRRSLACVVVAG